MSEQQVGAMAAYLDSKCKEIINGTPAPFREALENVRVATAVEGGDTFDAVLKSHAALFAHPEVYPAQFAKDFVRLVQHGSEPAAAVEGALSAFRPMRSRPLPTGTCLV